MNKVNRQIFSYFHEPSWGVWEDDVYLAAAFLDGTAIRLDICKKDMTDGIKWEELQDIKNKCGFSAFDAVEFYPKDGDVINTANYRHLYIFGMAFPQIRRIT